jgi:signal transduction histidine kinase/HD-like signal output (HDOD) protein
MPDLREKRVELILQQLEELPTLPSVAIRILHVTADEKSDVKDVVSLISSDVALTTRILQLVHRADMGVRGDVTSVERAIIMLGFEAVRSAVLAISVFNTFSGDDADPARRGLIFSRDEFWKHSVATACCAELLADAIAASWRKEDRIEPSEAFVCGLLHDLGKVALDAVLPKSYNRVVEAVDLLRGNIADVERTVIGLDHMVVGKRLAERWQLPTNVRDSIWLHGQLPQALPATVRNPRLVNMISLADLLVREQHLGYSGNYSTTGGRQVLIEALRLNPDQVNQVMQRLVAQIEPRAKALGLGQAGSAELYQQALAQANRELGKVSGQLASRNRKLAARAKFFDALSGFQLELRPDAPPETVLRAVGQTAVGILDVPAAAVFSILPGQAFAEVLLCDKTGGVVECLLVDCLQRPQRPPAGEGPVQEAGEEMGWLLTAVSPKLAQDHRYWICLEAEGSCIGGVLWGGVAGESQRLSTQVQELTALGGGWSLALRTAQIREEARALSEQLAEANRQLQSAQNELLRTRTLITVGEMAAGAAHEMNNPLAVISGRSQLLAQQLADPKQKQAATLVYEQAHRLTDIISELMAFAKPVPPKPANVELDGLVHNAVEQAKAHADQADRPVEVMIGNLPQVHVDAEQVQAALAEVIDNAIQATDARDGRVTVHAAFDSYSGRVVLTVADNGTGMDERTLRRAFDPFFSAKAAGRRRGMGLPKALRWIESSGGTLRLESQVGQGARAVILLPTAAPASATTGQPMVERRAAQ